MTATSVIEMKRGLTPVQFDAANGQSQTAAATHACAEAEFTCNLTVEQNDELAGEPQRDLIGAARPDGLIHA